MSNLVPQQAHAPRLRAAFAIEHLAFLELLEARVGQIERDTHARHAVCREPLAGEPEVRAKDEFPRRELIIDPGDALLEFRTRDRHAEIAETQIEKFFI